MLAAILYVKYFDGRKVFKLFLSLICSFYVGFKWNWFFGNSNCLDCYGTDFCHYFQSHQVRLTLFSYVTFLINPKFTKSVFYGVLQNSSEIIVLKRKSRKRSVDSGELLNIVKKSEIPGNVIFCPGFRNSDSFLNLVGESGNKSFLWKNIEISIEPLLLRYFMHYQNWPFPKYLGACGDVIVQEFKGFPLLNFVKADFLTRAYLSSKLLQFAKMATFNSPHFIFYFTDISFDNLVISSEGDASLVDLDNIIMLDKENYIESVTYSIHSSETYDDYEYAYSPTDICNHYLSDHNYFTICKHILANKKFGLLREIPKNIKPEYFDIAFLMNECNEPKAISNRFVAGNKLQMLLENVTKDYRFLEIAGKT